MTSLKDQKKLLKDAGKGLVDGIRKHRGPLGSFTEFPKEIIRGKTIGLERRVRFGRVNAANFSNRIRGL